MFLVLYCAMFDGAYGTECYIQHTDGVHNPFLFTLLKFWFEVVSIYFMISYTFSFSHGS